MHFRRWWGAMAMLAVAVVGYVPAASAADEKQVEQYLQAFYESALWHDGRSAVWARKWAQPLRLRFAGLPAEKHRGFVLERLGAMTRIAGLEYSVVPPGQGEINFLVEFVDTAALTANGRAAGCVAHTYSGPGNVYAYAHIVLNLRMGHELNHCITHELFHALGFPGHPHGSDSVLSYVYRRDDLTDADRMSLAVLYDPRISAGAFQLPAMAVAREVIVDKLIARGEPAETRELGRKFINNLVPLTTGLAEKGDVSLQYQLGIAYTFGQIVEPNPEFGLAWLKRAAGATEPRWRTMAVQAQAMVGHAFMMGRGTARDAAAAVPWYRQAADHGHLMAQQMLGIAYRDGRGVERDAVEAYKWLTLAAQQKDREAATFLASLTPALSAAEIEEGQRRAMAWKPAETNSSGVGR